MIGLTAGASAPEILVQQVVGRLCELGAEAPVEELGQVESVSFSMPKELRVVASDAR